MIIRSISKNVRISNKKLKLILKIVDNNNIIKTLDLLENLNKKSAFLFIKTLKSAIYNAKNNFDININDLKIQNIIINKAKSFKRILPRAKGRFDYIKKRNSHIKIFLIKKSII